MSAGFTPEAWELRFTEEAPGFPPSPFVATAGDVVCIAEPNHEQPDEFDLRNFQLIASAPRLYQAAWTAKEALKPCLDEPLRTVFWELVDALNLARGEAV